MKKLFTFKRWIYFILSIGIGLSLHNLISSYIEFTEYKGVNQYFLKYHELILQDSICDIIFYSCVLYLLTKVEIETTNK